MKHPCGPRSIPVEYELKPGGFVFLPIQAKKWRSAFKTDTGSLNPRFILEKLRIFE